MGHLLDISIKASIEAGNEIINVYNSEDFSVEIKSDNSPLTRADKAAHIKICSFLEKTAYPILSEEGKHQSYDQRKQWKTFWLVDPLDGTKEFIKRNGEFTVNIALIENEEPILGVVYVPVSGEIYFASEAGAYKALVENNSVNEDAVQKLPISKEREKFIVVGSRSHMSDNTEEYIRNLDKKGKELEMISKGSSLKICLVAEGAADCYPRLGPTMEWDTAAGHAIAKYAGFSVNTYPENKPMIYNKENLLNPFFIVG